jgi:hypothetical protein
MSTIFARTAGALAATAAVTASAVVVATPAGASTAISNPRFSVVCTQPHFGQYYTAVRFRQHGRWSAHAPVTVTLANAKSDHPKAEMHIRTGPHGWFWLRRTLHSSNTGPWVAGVTYTWTTEIIGDAAVARRGTVTLTNRC